MRTVIIDGGGTTTEVGLAIDGQCVARTSLPSVKPTPADLHTDELCRMLGSFLAGTSVTPDADVTSRLNGVVVGMAGVWSASEIHRYKQALRDSWEIYVGTDVPDLAVMSDAELVVYGAYGAGPGIVVIAGTGSIGLLRNADGSLRRCGGWGPRIDDAGGGFWLGRQACKAVARMLDGRSPDTLLIRPVAAYVRADADDPESVRSALRRTSIDGAARLGAAVLTYAEEGDAVARSIRDIGATSLAELVTTLDPMIDHTVTVYGSLWHNAAYVREVSEKCGRPLLRINDLLDAVTMAIDPPSK